MTQPSDVLEFGSRYIGYRETPDGSSYVDPITPWWAMQDAWCACFVSYVFWHCGLPLGPIDHGHSGGFIWCDDGASWFRDRGALLDSRAAEPGDVGFFEWSGGPGTFRDHTGIVVANDGHGLTVLEGNAQNRVDVWYRSYGDLFEVGRPPWTPNTPPVPERTPAVSIATLTYPADHPTHWSDGVEFAAAVQSIAWRHENDPADHRPENWSGWSIITPTSGAKAPGPIDSVTARFNAQGCLELLAWLSTDLNHKYRCWELTPGGRWDGWLDVP